MAPRWEAAASGREEFALGIGSARSLTPQRRRFAQQGKDARLDHIDRMAPATAVLVVGGVARIVPRHQAGANKIGDCAADIGAPDRLDLLLDRLVDARGIALSIASERVFQPRGNACAQRRTTCGLFAHRQELGAEPFAQEHRHTALRHEGSGLPSPVGDFSDQLEDKERVARAVRGFDQDRVDATDASDFLGSFHRSVLSTKGESCESPFRPALSIVVRDTSPGGASWFALPRALPFIRHRIGDRAGMIDEPALRRPHAGHAT